VAALKIMSSFPSQTSFSHNSDIKIPSSTGYSQGVEVVLSFHKEGRSLTSTVFLGTGKVTIATATSMFVPTFGTEPIYLSLFVHRNKPTASTYELNPRHRDPTGFL